MTHIPPHELDLLRITMTEAAELAAEGQGADGYDTLQGAIYRAEGLLTEGYPWADELLNRWRQALRQYQAFYGTSDK